MAVLRAPPKAAKMVSGMAGSSAVCWADPRVGRTAAHLAHQKVGSLVALMAGSKAETRAASMADHLAGQKVDRWAAAMAGLWGEKRAARMAAWSGDARAGLRAGLSAAHLADSSA